MRLILVEVFLILQNVINQDFDIDEHDKAMKRLFSEEFYSLDDPNFNPGGDNAGEGKFENQQTKYASMVLRHKMVKSQNVIICTTIQCGPKLLTMYFKLFLFVRF